MKDKAYLIGDFALAGSPIGCHLNRVHLNEVLGLSPVAQSVHLVMLGLTSQDGCDVADIEALRRSFEADDDPVLSGPDCRSPAGFSEAAQIVSAGAIRCGRRASLLTWLQPCRHRAV